MTHNNLIKMCNYLYNKYNKQQQTAKHYAQVFHNISRALEEKNYKAGDVAQLDAKVYEYILETEAPKELKYKLLEELDDVDNKAQRAALKKAKEILKQEEETVKTILKVEINN